MKNLRNGIVKIRHFVLVLALFSILSSPALAQQNLAPDPLGDLYVSAIPDGYDPNIQSDRGIPFNAYLVADIDFADLGDETQNLNNGLTAWEAGVTFPLDAIVLGANLDPSTSLNFGQIIGQTYEYIVGTGQRLEVGQPRELVEFTLLNIAEITDGPIQLGPVTTPTVEGSTAWVEFLPLNGCQVGTQDQPCVFRFDSARGATINSTISPDEEVVSIGNASYLSSDGVRRVELPVVLTNASDAIDAWGVDIEVPAEFTLIGCRSGDLTRNWTEIDCSELSSTLVRVGGFDLDAIAAGSRGTLAYLTFEVPSCEVSGGASYDLCVVDAVDGLADANFGCGTVTCSLIAVGDVNGSGQITSGDALCAFDGWLADGAPACAAPSAWPRAADVDCSNEVTPADALCIFQYWLDGSCAFCNGRVANVSRRAAPAIALEHTWIDHGTSLELVVSTEQAVSLGAWGLEWSVDPGMGQPASVEFGASLQAELVASGARIGDGVLRVGVATEPIDHVAGDVLFRASWDKDDGVKPQASLLKGVDDLAAATSVAGRSDIVSADRSKSSVIASPNPFNPRTTLTVFVGDKAGDGAVTLDIVDARGRRVQSFDVDAAAGSSTQIVWNGKDARGGEVSSGIYFVRLNGVADASVTKITLVR